ncbi:MAG TPA: ABC transporter ATP-binding protein [Verrucomicrobiae bacterium]|nr:ABC transporter ATP-binding protein [Verrucomicrobiae bacterium]
MTPAIDVVSLEKRYRDVEALRGVSLAIPQGSFFGLLGPNGAGKSTLINILTGLASPTSGKASVLGHDVVRDYRASRRQIGLAPQEFNFDRFFPIVEILVYQGGYFGLPRAEARRRAEELLVRFGLWDKRHEKTPRLSGGMKRRLLIAKAMIHDPPILILDEPTAGVDVELRRDLWEYWTEINARGKTIVLTTHYLEEAEALCRTLGVIDLGTIITTGAKDEVIAQAGGDLSNYFLKERRKELR